MPRSVCFGDGDCIFFLFLLPFFFCLLLFYHFSARAIEQAHLITRCNIGGDPRCACELNGSSSLSQASLLRQHLGAAWKAVARFSSAVAFPNFCNDLAFTWWLRTFIGWFVIGPHIKGGAAGKAPDTLEAIAKLRGDIGHQFVLFVQSMIAAGLTGERAGIIIIPSPIVFCRLHCEVPTCLATYHRHQFQRTTSIPPPPPPAHATC